MILIMYKFLQKVSIILLQKKCHNTKINGIFNYSQITLIIAFKLQVTSCTIVKYICILKIRLVLFMLDRCRFSHTSYFLIATLLTANS